MQTMTRFPDPVLSSSPRCPHARPRSGSRRDPPTNAAKPCRMPPSEPFARAQITPTKRIARRSGPQLRTADPLVVGSSPKRPTKIDADLSSCGRTKPAVSLNCTRWSRSGTASARPQRRPGAAAPPRDRRSVAAGDGALRTQLVPRDARRVVDIGCALGQPLAVRVQQAGHLRAPESESWPYRTATDLEVFIDARIARSRRWERPGIRDGVEARHRCQSDPSLRSSRP